MTLLESLQTTVANYRAAALEMQQSVGAVPQRIRDVVADFAAENPAGEGQGSIPDAALVEMIQTLDETTRVILSSASALAVMFDNQIENGDPERADGLKQKG